LQYPQTIGELASLKDECIKRLKAKESIIAFNFSFLKEIEVFKVF
jgi:hypothetical protein